MNTLTKNRIIENGDEFLLDGKWQPVPPNLHGVQVMFTGLTQVRRPNEEPPTPHTAKVISHNTEPISPDSRDSAKADPVAKAESENITLVPTHSGTGASLPTVVSKKAHRIPMAEMSAEDAVKLADTLAAVFGKARLDAHIPYPATATSTIWIGRNGTFNATGLNLHKLHDDRIRIVPQGKRGEAKNALIEFPVEVIPQIIEWLKEHQP